MISKEKTTEIYNTMTLLLAEKRTSLAVLRTAIALFTVPLSVFTILIATSRYYNIYSSLHFLIPLLAICFSLILFGVYLIFRSFRRIKDIDHKINEIKTKSECMKNFI